MYDCTRIGGVDEHAVNTQNDTLTKLFSKESYPFISILVSFKRRKPRNSMDFQSISLSFVLTLCYSHLLKLLPDLLSKINTLGAKLEILSKDASVTQNENLQLFPVYFEEIIKPLLKF